MRRIFLITTIGTALALSSIQTPTKTPAQTSSESSRVKSKGYVLQPEEGEKLADPIGGIIKVSPDVGSQRLSMVVQPLPTGKRIGVHMHELAGPFGGSLEQAAKRVKADVLIIISANDHIQRPEPATEFARLIAARIVKLDSNCGHFANDCEAEQVAKEVNTFLAR